MLCDATPYALDLHLHGFVQGYTSSHELGSSSPVPHDPFVVSVPFSALFCTPDKGWGVAPCSVLSCPGLSCLSSLMGMGMNGRNIVAATVLGTSTWSRLSVLKYVVQPYTYLHWGPFPFRGLHNRTQRGSSS